MRTYTFLPLAAALASAFVVPDEKVMSSIKMEHGSSGKLDKWQNKLSEATDSAKTAIEDAYDAARHDAHVVADELVDYAEQGYVEAEAWMGSFREEFHRKSEAAFDKDEHFERLIEHSREWYADLGLGDCSHSEEEDQHHGRRPHHPHHPHHPHKSNLTAYQMIKKSKYTTRLAKLVDQFPEVVEKLNGTESNFTLFAPIDSAFEKLDPYWKKFSKEFLLATLAHHVVKDNYPALRVLKSNTLPTVLSGEGLSEHPEETPQRLSVRLGFRGLTLNFFSHVVAANVEATNAVIHGVDTPLLPPPKAADVIQAFPGAFSTLELALWKTGLKFALNDTSNHLGGSLFAPSNRAWERLGPRANAFLFSRYGQKYLKALVKYHMAPNVSLYSDALYASGTDETEKVWPQAGRPGTFHIDLPTALHGKSLSVDVARWSRFVDIRINGFYDVAVPDVAVYDGVVHVMNSVLIPPKAPGAFSKSDKDIGVEELKERLGPYVEEEEEEEGKQDGAHHPDYLGSEVPQEHVAFDLPLEL